MTYEEAILRELRAKLDSLKEALCNGQAKDYAEYKYMVGEIRGLSFACNVTTDLADKIRKADD